MNAPIDVTAVLFEQRSKPRGDEHLAHCADLYGCDRATWYRRRGLKPAPFTPSKLAQFAIGHGYEGEVRETLAEAGLKLMPDGTTVEFLGLTGHPDIVVTENVPDLLGPSGELVVEVKTTELVNPKDEVSPHYAIQAAFYALALQAPRAVVLVKHAKSHAEVPYEVDPEEWRAIIEQRAAEVLERTHPDAPIPPMEPSELAKWGCSYCEWRRCARNPKWDGTRELEADAVEDDGTLGDDW